MTVLPNTMPILSDMRATHIYGGEVGIIRLAPPLELKKGDVVLQVSGMLGVYRPAGDGAASGELLKIEEQRIGPPDPPTCTRCNGTGREP